MTATLQRALELADLGYRVFPCSGKAPAIAGGSGCLDASTDPATLQRFWTDHPQAGIGIATGDSLVVFDGDTYKDGFDTDKCAELRKALPNAPTQTTPNGGTHLFARHAYPVICKSVNDALGRFIDRKGAGGYVLDYGADLPALDDIDALASVALCAASPSKAPNGTSANGTSRHGALLRQTLRDTRAGLSPDEVLARARSSAVGQAMRIEGRDAEIVRMVEGAIELPTEFRLTDLGNAERFVADHADELRYCHPWHTWLAQDGRCWQPDDTATVFALAKETVREMYREAAASDETKRKALGKHAVRSESQRALRAMVELAQSERCFAITDETLNQHPWLLNCKNGTLDLRTGKLKPHDPADMLTYCLDTAYDRDADPLEVWVPFLEDIFCGDWDLINFVQRALGYSLTGDVSETAWFILYGASGSNGKSTFVRTITAMLGSTLAQGARTDTFLRSRTDRDKSLDLIRMRGARIVTASEVTAGKEFDSALIKQLTGGDTVVGRAHYRMPEEFTPEFKIWFMCNDLPNVKDNSHAMWRRVRTLPFLAQFEGADEDKQMGDKLAANMPAILKWCVDGCLLWQQGGLGTCEAVQAATESYRTQEDILAEFVRARIGKDADGEVLNKDAYAAYKKWCEAEDTKAITIKTFAARMRQRDGIDERRTKHGLTWVGITLI